MPVHGVDVVVRLDCGTALTAAAGTCLTLGTEGLQPSELCWGTLGNPEVPGDYLRWLPHLCSRSPYGRPRDR